MVVRELFAKFGLQFDSASLKKVEAGLTSLKSSAFVLSGALAGIGAGFYAIVKSASNVGEELYNTSQKLGLTVEGLQRLRYAAKLANIDQDSFNMSMGFFNKTLQDARNGSQDAAKALSALGLNPKTAKLSEESLQRIADRIKGISDPAKKADLLRSVFGKQGAQMIPFFNQGAKGIKELGDEIEAAGLITTEQAKASEAFNTELAKTEFQISTLKNSIGIQFIPIFKDMIERFNKWLMLNRQLLKLKIASFLKDMVTLFGRVAELVGMVADLFDEFAHAVGGTKNGLLLLGAVAIGLGIAFGVINPIIFLVTALGAALLLIYDDYKGFGEGKDTFFDWGVIIPQVTDAFQFLGDVWAGIKVIAMGLWEALVQIWTVLDVIGVLEPFKWMWDVVKVAAKVLYYFGKIAATSFVQPIKDLAELGKRFRGTDQPVLLNDPSVVGPDATPAPTVPQESVVDRAKKLAQGISGGFSMTGQDFMTARAKKSFKDQAPADASTAPIIQNPSNKQTNHFNVTNKIDVHVQTGAEADLIGDAVAEKVRDTIYGEFSDGLQSLQPGTQY